VRKPLPTIPLTFRMTQVLTGHGCFQYYLHRMGRATNPLCVQCGSAVDTAEHTLLDCVYWEPFRSRGAQAIGGHHIQHHLWSLGRGSPPRPRTARVDHRGRHRVPTASVQIGGRSPVCQGGRGESLPSRRSGRTEWASRAADLAGSISGDSV